MRCSTPVALAVTSCLVLPSPVTPLGVEGARVEASGTAGVANAPPIEGLPFFWALSVRDVEASSAWYQRVLGFSEVRRIDMADRGVRIRLLRTDRAFLELVEQASARSLREVDAAIDRTYQVHGVYKLGLLVEDLDATLDLLGALEVGLRGSVFTEPDDSLRSAQIEDPDGNVLQLFERVASQDLDRTQGRSESRGPKLVNADGVTALLDVMDALAVVHPDAAERERSYGELEEVEREEAYDAARRRNEGDVEVRSAIDALLGTETYQIYFRRFPNITAERLNELLLELPYRQLRAPGDVGVTLYELFRRRETIRTALDRLLRESDMEWVYETAQRFAPGWKGELPTMHLIYDSNAGSFAAEGRPFFNVFTGLDLVALAEGSGARSLEEAAKTMAHELQHVLVESILYPETEEERSWQEEWIDQMTRGTVGEGLANLCSPPSGRKRDVYEDPSVLEALAERFNLLLSALVAGEITQDEVRFWYRENYSDVAIGLLRGHLAKRYSGAELDAEIDFSMSFRPDFEHAFGWWMVSRIWESDPRREVVADLLANPLSVYRLYNETLTEAQSGLGIAAELIEPAEPR